MSTTDRKIVLHVGCGVKKPGRLHAMFGGEEWDEVRLDINPDARPDLLASITDMRIVNDASMDALYSSHNLEHLFPHEIPQALKEFRRVLKPDGFALITLPDIQAAAEVIASGNATKTLYNSPMGPVTALDIVFGHRKALAQGKLNMLHKFGFTSELLAQSLRTAGFQGVRVQRDAKSYSLWAMAHVSAQSQASSQAAGAKLKAQGETAGPFGE